MYWRDGMISVANALAGNPRRKLAKPYPEPEVASEFCAVDPLSNWYWPPALVEANWYHRIRLNSPPDFRLWRPTTCVRFPLKPQVWLWLIVKFSELTRVGV